MYKLNAWMRGAPRHSLHIYSLWSKLVVGINFISGSTAHDVEEESTAPVSEALSSCHIMVVSPSGRMPSSTAARVPYSRQPPPRKSHQP